MNKNQEYILKKALEQMQIVRHMLDDVMYYNEPLPDDEQKKVRSSYGKLCESIDSLPIS